VLASACALGAGHDGVVVEGGEGDAAGRVLGRQVLRVRARHVPRHEGLGLAAAVVAEEDGGGDHLAWAAGVPGPGPQEREVLGHLDGAVGGAGLADADLERGDGGGRVLAVRADQAAAAAVGDLLVVRHAGQKVDHGRGALAAVRDVALELGAVPLLRGLRAHHGPDHLLLRPRPAQRPPRRHDVPVHLEVVDRHHRLRAATCHFGVSSRIDRRDTMQE
jgi:hypothetical protein